MIVIPSGNIYQSTATFTDSVGVLTNPTTVAFTYQVEGASPVTLAYAGATVPAIGIVACPSVGVFIAQVDLTGVTGAISRQWASTGVAQAASPTDYVIVPS